jgi:hypothetical protein
MRSCFDTHQLPTSNLLIILVKNRSDEKYSNLKFDLVNLYGMLQDFKGEARQFGLNLRYEF